MTDNDPTEISETGGIKSVALTILSGVGTLFAGGILVGFFSAHMEDGGGPLSQRGLAIAFGLVTLFLLCAVILLKRTHGIFSRSKSVGRREKLNQRIMLGAVILGIAIGLILTISGENMEHASPFDSNSMNPTMALILAAITGLIIPLISYYWHQNATDELDQAAYRDGAMWACYFYWIVSATWWFLWRGGLVPPVNGVIIFFGSVYISLGVWLWKKYR